jgi:hypothetical protein
MPAGIAGAMNDSFGEVATTLGHRVTSAVHLEPVVGDAIFLMGERPEVAESRHLDLRPVALYLRRW